MSPEITIAQDAANERFTQFGFGFFVVLLSLCALAFLLWWFATEKVDRRGR